MCKLLECHEIFVLGLKTVIDGVSPMTEIPDYVALSLSFYPGDFQEQVKKISCSCCSLSSKEGKIQADISPLCCNGTKYFSSKSCYEAKRFPHMLESSLES